MAPGEPVRVSAVAQADGLAAAVLQLAEDGQALAQRGGRGAGVAVVAVHDGELPQRAGLPAAVAQAPRRSRTASSCQFLPDWQNHVSPQTTRHARPDPCLRANPNLEKLTVQHADTLTRAIAELRAAGDIESAEAEETRPEPRHHAPAWQPAPRRRPLCELPTPRRRRRPTANRAEYAQAGQTRTPPGPLAGH